MLDSFLQIVAPHHCYGCGVQGHVLCPNCKYNIKDQPFGGCLNCGRLAQEGVCSNCQVAYSRAWCVGERAGELSRAINGFKFERVKAAVPDLVELFHDTLPQLPDDTIIVPVPTVPGHIRRRGYDHCLLLAQGLASRRNLAVKRLVVRVGRSRQLGQTRQVRLRQAQISYRLAKETVDPEPTYLVLDDVVTTGATINAVATCLSQGGARTIYAAALAYQPLDQKP